MTARVPNKSDTTAVHFRGGSAAQLAITSVLPNRGKPQGGDQVVIRGQGFIAAGRRQFHRWRRLVPRDHRVRGRRRQLDHRADAASPGLVIGRPSRGRPGDSEGRDRCRRSAGVSVTGTGLFTFSADTGVPLLYSVVPSTGSVAGGDIIVLTGRYFTEPLGVDFVFAVGSFTRLRSLRVQHRADGVDVATVVTPQASSRDHRSPRSSTSRSRTWWASKQPADHLSQRRSSTSASATAAPAIYYISPTYGSVDGGETVMIFGKNFDQSARCHDRLHRRRPS